MTDNYIADISVDTVIEALSAFILPFVPGGQIVRAEVNDTAAPPDPFVLLTEVGHYALGIPYDVYEGQTTTGTIIEPLRIDVQADFFGESSGDYCKTVKGALSTVWGWDNFPANVKPLYTSDAIQSPFITAEQQYSRRWILTVSLEYNPNIIVPQQSADVATATIHVPADLNKGQ